MEILSQADLDGGQVVIAATQGEALAFQRGICRHKQGEDRVRRHGCLVVESAELLGDAYLLNGLACRLEIALWSEAGAGAMRLPLVPQETRIRVEIAKVRRVRRRWIFAAVLRVGAVGVLRPKPVEHKAEVPGTLRLRGMGGAELGGPGEIE